MLRNVIFIFLGLLYLNLANGQYIHTRTYTEEDGLAPGIVNIISQDQYGYTWIGTRNGLSKFDGRSFTTYFGDVSDSLSLKNSEIFDLCHTDKGNIWIATSGGLSYYNRKTNLFKNYNQEDGLKMNVIKKVVQQNDSIIWVGHWFGVDRINTKNWNVTSFSPSGPSRDTILYHHSPNHIKNLKFNKKENIILISHQNKIERFDAENDSFTTIFKSNINIDGSIDDFFWVNDNELIVTTAYDKFYYIVYLTTGNSQKIALPKKHLLDQFAGINNDNIVILDRHKGPTILDINDYSLKQIYQEIEKNTFTTIFINNKNKIWTGTFAGIQIYEPDANQYYIKEGHSITSTVYDPFNNIIIGINDKVPLLYKNNNGKLIQKPFNFKNLNPYGIIYSVPNTSFLSFNNNTITFFDPLSDIKNVVPLSNEIKGYINQVKEVENGFLISAGQRVYSISITGEVQVLVSHNKRIFSAYSFNGGIFFSCIGNLLYAKNGNKNVVHQQSSFTRARGMAITGDTSLWFTEIHTGLIEINLQVEGYNIKKHGKNEGLNSQIMYGIYREGDAFLIPATYCFYKYDPKTHQVLETYKKGNKYATYDLAYDIYSIDENHYASGVAPGIMVFPKKANQIEISDLRIDQIKIKNEEIIYHIPSEIELQHFENDINIQLESCFYGEKNDVLYYYKINDEETYNLVGSSPSLNFNNLSPGKYDISIKASSNNSETEIENAIKIIINPPWWATKLFVFASTIFLVISFLYWYRRRMKHLKSQHEIEKKLIHLESIALKSQINPHFLFNSLNGIRTLISLKENEKAIKYVSHLSQLLRDSLTYHQVNFISLAQEFEMNRHYLELEKLRFDEKLSWSFNEEMSVNLTEIKIPPFTLQPLIENAIHHGIRYIDGPGKIVISTIKEDGLIKISVLDNGIGLIKAAELQKGKIRLRDHIGLSIVEKRISLLNGKLFIKDRIGNQGVEASITFKVKRDEKV